MPQEPQTLSPASSQSYPASSYAPVVTPSYLGNPLQDSQGTHERFAQNPSLETFPRQATNVPQPTTINSNLPSYVSPTTDVSMQQDNFDPNYNPIVAQPARAYSFVGQQESQQEAYGQPNMSPSPHMTSPPSQMQQAMPTMQTHPPSVQPMQTMQPSPAPGMDIRNVKGLPRDGNGEREWSHGWSKCFDDCGTCMLGWCCPCMLYSKIQTRLNHLETRGVPHPNGGDAFASDCLVHGILECCGHLDWILHLGQTRAVRSRYRIAGNGFTDCMMSYFCSPCEMTQVSREIELEERAFMPVGTAVMQAPTPQMEMNPNSNPNPYVEKR